MKRSISHRLMFALAGVFILSGMGMAAEFTADLIQTGPKTLNKGKLYVKGGKIRQEVTEGSKFIVIDRPDKDLTWIMNPKYKTYMKVTDAIIRGIDDPRAWERFKDVGKALPATKATINGYSCTKRSWVLGKGKLQKTLTEWKSDKLNFVIRRQKKELASTWLIDYKNIKVGTVPDSVFEVPKGYQLVPTPVAPVKGEE